MKHSRKTSDRRQSRGFTLVELAIVMALLALVGVVVVGFVTVVSGQARTVNARADFMEATLSFRCDLERAFAEGDAPGEASVSFSDGVLTVGAASLSLSDYPEITDVETELSADKTLLKIILTSDESREASSFLLASHCGATFAGGGQGE